MKIMFASDIHGSAFYCKKMLEAYRKEKAEKLILLGDILYHGPRNDLPEQYAPKEVIQLLNDDKSELFAIRGNCDAEVDQMVLQFPIMADYAVLFMGNKVLYATHGHVYNEDNLPPIKEGELFIYGHTHIPRAEKRGGHIFLNPGSVSLPKGGNIPSYGIMTDTEFCVKGFGGEAITRIEF